MRRTALFLGVLILGLLGGCASIVSDNKSTTYLETDPEASRCELHGQDFKRVVTTPNSISLPSEAAPLTVSCSAPGYKRTTATLDTKMDGWIWGNILLGGGIGLIVDATRGAGFKYPTKLSLVLEPEEFRTLDDRDAWYDKRKAEIATTWEQKIKKVKSQCSNNTSSPGDSGNEDACKRIVADEEKKRDAEFEANEKAKGAAKVAQVIQAAK